MSRGLLDINVMLALVDPDHVNHEHAHSWAATELATGWATCALTQNGFVRIISQPKYPNPLTVPAAAELLRALTADARHEFWPSELPLTDSRFRTDRLLRPRQVTDAYLLGLAVAHRGRLVTFDGRIDIGTVEGAVADDLLIL